MNLPHLVLGYHLGLKSQVIFTPLEFIILSCLLSLLSEPPGDLLRVEVFASVSMSDCGIVTSLVVEGHRFKVAFLELFFLQLTAAFLYLGGVKGRDQEDTYCLDLTELGLT
jgi:hypothetical protein